MTPFSLCSDDVRVGHDYVRVLQTGGLGIYKELVWAEKVRSF